MTLKSKDRFIPITMYCNEEQYHEIRKKLKDSVFNFDEEKYSNIFPYITNNYEDEKYRVAQVTQNRKGRIILPFDIDDFLYYSGIDLDEEEEEIKEIENKNKLFKLYYAVKEIKENSENFLISTITENKTDAIQKYEDEFGSYNLDRDLKKIKTVKILINEV